MNKLMLLMLLAAIAAILTGCQTRITATKHAEIVHPIERVVQVNGQDQVIVDSYQVSSGGWEATARSPLYATEALDGLSIGVETNGTVKLDLNRYNRDLSTNSVTMTKTMFDGGAQLVTAIGEAYVKIAGGGAQADTILSVARNAYNDFVLGGGDATKSTVTVDDGKVKVTDGSVCTTCKPDGTCTTGACADCTL